MLILNTMSLSLFKFITIQLLAFSTGYKRPSTSYGDLAKSVRIVASSTCSVDGAGYTCTSSTCPSNSRQSTPDPVANLTESDIPDICKVTANDLPAHVNKASVHIDNSNSVNCSITKTIEIQNKYTASFWIKQNCQQECKVIELEGSSKIVLSVAINLLHFNGNTTQWRLRSNFWDHVVFRKTALFINGVKHEFSTGTTSIAGDITINPAPVSSNSFSIADLRIYGYALTDREVKKIYQDTFPPLATNSSCRCPDNYPVISDIADPQGIYCTDDNKTANESRLNVQSHRAGFANDWDQTTSWISGPSNEASLTLTLDNIVQIFTTDIFLGTKPQQIKVEMKHLTHTRNLILTSSNISSSNVATFDLRSEISRISNRKDLEETLAKTIVLTFQGHADSKNYYEVKEINITGRCNCFGNGNICPRDGRIFTCECDKSNTYTEGRSCENCQQGHYRQENEFGCTNACLCNNEGTKPTTNGTCNEVGGQCECKTNVEGRTCNTCKSLAYNFTSHNVNGCTQCPCDGDGTLNCSSTTGECFCKNYNYDASFKDCSKCKPNYYGRQKPEGCIPCNCNISGVKANNLACHETDGNCTCKDFVMGRRCDQCQDGYWGLNRFDSQGCKRCTCNTIGSSNGANCDKETGDCFCRSDVQEMNKQCNPSFTGELMPPFGPESGGTMIEVNGVLFGNKASKIHVYFSKPDQSATNLPVSSVNDTRLEFSTKALNWTGTGKISIVWAKALLTTPNTFNDHRKEFNFEYKPDPVVTEAESIRSFKSGGCDLRLKGLNLESVYRPKLIVYFTDGTNSSKSCKQPEASEIKCGIPDLSLVPNGEVLSYGFILDGLTKYMNVSQMFPNSTITVFDNPKGVKMDITEFKVPFMKSVTMKGSGFSNACNKQDYRIKIGDKSCPITMFTDTEIVCEPDASFPGSGREETVTLYIGDKRYYIGMLTMKTFWSTTEFIGIACGVGGFLIIIIVLCIAIKCCCCKKKKQNNAFDDIMQGNSNPACEVEMVEDKQPKRIPSRYTPMPVPGSNTPSESDNNTKVEEFLQRLECGKQLELSLIERKDIELDKRCTKRGTDIRIIDGNYSRRKTTMKTLVKTVSSYSAEEPFSKLINNGLTECLRLRDCCHENILQIYGCSVDQDRFYIIYPTTRRILKDHLNDIKGQTFKVVDLVRMTREIAEGIVYLDIDMKIVHKDLATRNCFITDGGSVKICDASFSWDLFPKEYMYDSVRERYLPVRWMAPESLQSGFYDNKTDIWSFGVVMWEMMSRSIGLPFWDVKEDKRIANHVQQGNRLGKPADTPEQMYNLMLQCWQHDSNLRPEINNIVNQLVMIENPDDFESSNLYQNLNAAPDNMGPPPSLPPRADQVYGNIP